MNIKQYIINLLQKKNQKPKILFIDGNDKRAVQAANLHDDDNLIEPILLYEKRSEVLKSVHCKTMVIEDYMDQKESLIKTYVERRNGKETAADAEAVIFTKTIFAMLMLQTGAVDGVIGGLVDPTAVILKGAFKIIKPKPGVKTISSIMLMERAHEWYIFTDISVNITPSKSQLIDIAANAANFAKKIDFKTKLAFLSFSTSGSAVHPRSILVKEACEEFDEKYKSPYKSIGEVQFDAAFDPKIRKMKYKDSDAFKKNPTIFVFPSLEAGNIGYKIAQRMGGFGAIGPIITGVNKPVNDLSRGSTIMDIYNTALVTGIQMEEK